MGEGKQVGIALRWSSSSRIFLPCCPSRNTCIDFNSVGLLQANFRRNLRISLTLVDKKCYAHWLLRANKYDYSKNVKVHYSVCKGLMLPYSFVVNY